VALVSVRGCYLCCGLGCCREVDKEDFGLKPEEVLSMEDKELNDLVGMRLLAPYREDGWRLKKQRFKVAAALGPKRRAQAESAVWHDKRKEAKRERQKEKKAAAREGGVKKEETGVHVAGKRVKVTGRGKEKRTNVKGGEVGDVEKLHDQAEKEGGSEEKGKEKEKKATEKGVRAKEARMSSYAVPKLSRPDASQTSGGKGQGKGTKRKREEEREAKLGAKAGLSRAAKRNARRAEKRAEKHVVAE
jgi:protein KRI1